MTTRYFKATDGHRTVFRSSPSRIYRSATIAFPKTDFVFSMHDRSPCKVVEITKAEYDRLNAAKKRRFEAMGYTRAGFSTAPRDSWVYNRDIEGDRT